MKMSAVSTRTRFWRAGIEPAISDPVSGTDERFSPLKPTPELFQERIFPEIAVLWNVRAGVEPALDSFGILSASVYVKSPISEGCQLSVLPIEHTAHHALIDVPDIYFGNILAQYAKPMR